MRVIMIVTFVGITAMTYGQSCCTGGIPFTGQVSTDPIATGRFQFDFKYDRNIINDLIIEKNELDNETNFRMTNSLFLQIGYGVGEKLSIAALISYVFLEEEILTSSPVIRFNSHGIGDMLLLGSYKILNRNQASLALGTGIKIPTGKTNKTGINDFILPPTLQPGTGSIDFLAFLNYSTAVSFRKQANLNVSMTFRYHTETQQFSNVELYQFGNVLQTVIGYADQLHIGKMFLSPSINIRLRYSAEDSVNNNLNNNTGGIWLTLDPGLGFNLNPNFILSVNESIPVYRNLNGFQLTTSHRLTLSMRIKQ